MLKKEILEQLIYLTSEEKANLSGQNSVDKTIYVTPESNIIDYTKLLSDGEEISVRKHTRFCYYPKHKHNYIELMYVYSGKMTQIIDNQVITINKGDLLLLNQNVEHSVEYTDEEDIIFNFIIKPDFLEFFSQMMNEKNDLSVFILEALYSYQNKGEYLIFKTQEIDSVQKYIELIIENMYTIKVNREVELKLLVGLLLVELMNYPELIETHTLNSRDKVLMSSILKYIVTFYQEGSLKELAEKLNVPDYKIAKFLKRETGKTFKELIQRERLKVAENLLLCTNMTVEDITFEIGYQNSTHFYSLFKQCYGLTPNEYRISKKAK